MADTFASNGTATADVDPYAELGVTGLRHSSGRLAEEFIPELRGDRAMAMWREMSEDPIAGSSVQVLVERVRRCSWSVTPADSSPKALEVADHVTTCMGDMSHSFGAAIDEVLSSFHFGWAFLEAVYKRRDGASADAPGLSSKYKDGRIGWRKLPIRAQETRDRWDLDDHGGIQGLYQRSLNSFRYEVYIPIQKALLFRTVAHKGNPEGQSLHRRGYVPYIHRKRIQVSEAIALDRGLGGIPVIGVPRKVMAGTGDAEAAKRAWEEIGANIRLDEQAFVLYGLTYDQHGNPETKLDMLTGPAVGDYDVAITRYATWQAMTVFADVMLLGHEQVGSEALSRTKLELLYSSLQGMADGIADVFTRHAIPRLCALNGWPPELSPTMTHSPVEDVRADELAEMLKALTGAGINLFPAKELEKWLLSTLNVPAAVLAEHDLLGELQGIDVGMRDG